MATLRVNSITPTSGSEITLTAALVTATTTFRALNYKHTSFGTFTQLTSQTTTVPVTTYAGKITMFSAAITGATAVSFSVTAAGFSDDSIILVDIATNPAVPTSQLMAYVTNSGSGTFEITIRNFGATTAAISPTIAYMVVVT
ncbi:hypothetical protein UFOVP997_26 [uncultured Caudovirales phage]|uniref:Uncharacterized protein n=1 Tax=uncultured Caudovirales phage TaxID=2100421 RepID=A0A6J5SGE2_9CAUD|nr:hypothetical protein UFOVP486_45 [uncultured Caudovirales phage]CAB4170290.1 hypothetical protein UFOVP911_26 [uncultured Caudovirales phage]CAB4177326.1 hypothetical protein UFOVP997_26 [uncultured Caudovirales phage]CAB4182488.1 hypothetical protein UFOVP1088_6 [uncultured Caudovirales phage]CAB4186397.1 hypothetical protein UFOVP1149_6 [uncultured Caudovirales phage]